MYTFDFTPPQVHELVTSLHRNRARILGRIHRQERKAESPEEQERIACDPGRKVYLDAMAECRRCRINTIDGLLAVLETKE